MRVVPANRLEGDIAIPGDKSISHRYAILGGFATGQTRISHYSTSRDCQATLNCLRPLGIEIQRFNNEVEITSAGWREVRSPRNILDAENSGTTIRLLSALLSSRPILSTISGDDSLNQRPMARVIRPLARMGAQIQARMQQFPPLTIRGADLQAIRYELPVASAQVKSCVLLAGLAADGTTAVIEKLSSRDHTERALPLFGAAFEDKEGVLKVTGRKPLKGINVKVPGDFSSAVYFIVASLLLPESSITLRQVGVNPSRTALLELLEQAGAPIERNSRQCDFDEPRCDITVRHSERFLAEFPSEIPPRSIPNLIDEIPILAILGTRLKDGLTVRGAAELRKKESDRIRAIVENLQSIGVAVDETEDGFDIPPGQTIKGGTIRTFGDHRIAMAFAVAGLISDKGVQIDDPSCVSVSFPEFFPLLASVAS